ncbi:uncharacterized protein MELLADRAFT_51479 [Melampsora larici-populina 98AG31]|uniref:Ketoreductase domain-containing protein n=1 Tax=Melampsora larici-populina (strain 98AG31 / pathotype 3-4-7) TaxID=747676 RepID=F4R5A6_MELLP|nr:uncharacterized protein MELLADRAFT_51479 [Melampsora larici-populina 98AG31]EGG12014.1 hypothetical protein MELLADRAFT_51479 [Melampsora larici-populina 98AG31]
MKIKDKVFYVTGGVSGLGRAVVTDLLANDALVCIMDREELKGREIEQTHKGRVVFQKCDVRSTSDIEEAIKKSTSNWPEKRIGGLVHCAGVVMAGKTVSSTGKPWDYETFRTVVDINLNGTFNVVRLIAAHIVKSQPLTSTSDSDESEKGVMILTSSTSYQDGQMGQAAYASSKGGVASLVLPLTRDLAQFGIRVNAIAPSLFETAMSQGMSSKVRKNLLNVVEFPSRFGQAKDFSGLVLECIRNEYLNGTVIRLDGGSRMGKL